MTLKVHTARVSYGGPDRLDVTRKSAPPEGIAFAPSDDLLWPFIAKRRAGTLTDADHAEYRDKYLAEMRASYVANAAVWKALLARDEITLCCYCREPEHCHRTILARDVLTKLGAEFVGERPPMPEDPAEAPKAKRGQSKQLELPGSAQPVAASKVPAPPAPAAAPSDRVVVLTEQAPQCPKELITEFVDADGHVQGVLLRGDMRSRLGLLSPESIDSCVCDPPYGLSKEPDISEVMRHWVAGDEYEHLSSETKGKKYCAACILMNPVISNADRNDSRGQKEFVSFAISFGVGLMETRHVDLNCEASVGEVEIDHKGTVRPLKNTLVEEIHTNGNKLGNDVSFYLRKLDSFSGCVGVCSCFTKTDSSFLSVNVWLSNNPLAYSAGSSDVVTLDGTERSVVLTLDMTRRTGTISPAKCAFDDNCGLLLIPTKTVGTFPGASSLSSMSKSSEVSFVGAAANRACPDDRHSSPFENIPASFAASLDSRLDGIENSSARFTLFLHEALVTRFSLKQKVNPGMMGKSWDTFVPGPKHWAEVFRVLKPGAHLLAMSSSRTWDLLSIAIRMAGFEARDTIACHGSPAIAWTYGKGMPKSVNIGKAIDATLGAEREVVGHGRAGSGSLHREARVEQGYRPNLTNVDTSSYPITAPKTDEAKQWEGWGTALKPSFEVILVFRKPLRESTIAKQVLATGTAGLNIDACRVAHASADDLAAHEKSVAAIKERGGSMADSWKNSSDLSGANDVNGAGRWPPNTVLVHLPGCVRVGTKIVRDHPPGGDGNGGGTKPPGFADVGASSGEAKPNGKTHVSKDGTEEVDAWECAPGCAVAEIDRQSGTLTSGTGTVKRATGTGHQGNTYGKENRPSGTPQIAYGDTGGASRFFPRFDWEPEELETAIRYMTKSSPKDRSAGLPDDQKNTHPTVKPIKLLRWMTRLVTPPGGMVLDPFAGSGTTGIAATLEGFRFTLVELDEADGGSADLAIARVRGHAAARPPEPSQDETEAADQPEPSGVVAT